MLSDSPAPISHFQATDHKFYQGTDPILILRSCVSEAGRASMFGAIWWITATQMGTQCNQSQWETKTMKSTFAGNVQCRRMFFCWTWSCENVKVKWLLGTTKGENTWKVPTENWVPGQYSEPLCQVLLKLPVYLWLLAPYYDVNQFKGGFAILKNKRTTNCQNFLFWTLPWTPDMMNEYYSSSN